MRENQEIFRYTGGIHAAAIFDYNGNLISISEDIGRHNAVDKSIGKTSSQWYIKDGGHNNAGEWSGKF